MDVEQNQTSFRNVNTPQQQNSPLFGLIIPGQPVRTDFIPVDPHGMKYTLTIRDIHPDSVSDVVFFLLNQDFPSSHGAMLFSQISNSSNDFELLGAATTEKPSGIFRPNWNLDGNADRNSQPMNNFYTSYNDAFISVSSPSTITFGVSIETIENIKNLEISNKGVEDRVMDVAKKIALNLFNYLQSFDDCGRGQNGMMMVPMNVFERWLKRFQNKYRLDPNFLMKTGS